MPARTKQPDPRASARDDDSPEQEQNRLAYYLGMGAAIVLPLPSTSRTRSPAGVPGNSSVSPFGQRTMMLRTAIFFTQTEVQPRIVVRDVAGLTQHNIHLLALCGLNRYRRSDRASVRFGSLQARPLPNDCALFRSLRKERWRFTHVHDEHIDIAVVIEIPEGRAAARFLFLHAGTAR